METSTPVKTGSQKRSRQSPVDDNDLKKQLLSTSAQSDIAGLDSEESKVPDNPDNLRSMQHMSLSVANCKIIADAIKDSFKGDIHRMVDDCLSRHKSSAPLTEDSIQTIIKGVVSGLEGKIIHLERQNQVLTTENEELKKRLAKVETDTDSLEQYSRRNCLRISGVAESQSDTDSFVTKMCEDLGTNVNLVDVDRSHRIGKPGGTKPRPIIVKFTSYRARNAVYKNRSKLRQIGYRDVYINEDLTKHRSGLLFKARSLVKANKIQGAWSSDGTILIKDHRGTIKRIQQLPDLSSYE